eukprot:TRINITY_DN3137_c0_g1_i1.p1 TRINITY_DN3137_c0_g1~~TRINITY_DN3137_c0_g1_i1.p1  ORF type:complete len:567 (+),score=154.12 TRINITY_DN3137_c0_g1_i1:49-1701(+)
MNDGALSPKGSSVSSTPFVGYLSITIAEARSLPSLDRNGFSDPFCALCVRDKTRELKTTMKPKTLNPTWNETFNLKIEDPDTDVIEIKVWDYDTLLLNDFIGKVAVPVLALVTHHEEQEKWYPILDKHLKATKIKNQGRGELLLRTKYIPKGDHSPSSSSAAAQAIEKSKRTLSQPASLSESTGAGSGRPFWEIDFPELIFEEELGRGAFGVVFRGKWRLQDVAVKKLLDTLTDKELEDFKQEAALMTNLRPHRNVVQLIGICSNPDYPLCIVTEFLNSGSLSSLLSKPDFHLTWQLAHSILLGVAAGLYHLHSENILHRDLAARNILMDGMMEPRIADFGLSQKSQILNRSSIEYKKAAEETKLTLTSPSAPSPPNSTSSSTRSSSATLSTSSPSGGSHPQAPSHSQSHPTVTRASTATAASGFQTPSAPPPGDHIPESIKSGFRGPYKYMSPESLNDGHFSVKSDVYSFGILVWEIASRMPDPYPELDIYQAAYAVINHGIRPRIPSHIPPRFVHLMTWCWAQNPDDRPVINQVFQFLSSIENEVKYY